MCDIIERERETCLFMFIFKDRQCSGWILKYAKKKREREREKQPICASILFFSLKTLIGIFSFYVQ